MKNNFYKIGITKVKLQQFYNKHQFTINKKKCALIEDVPGNLISLREAANLGGQGYDRSFFARYTFIFIYPAVLHAVVCQKTNTIGTNNSNSKFQNI